MERPVQFRSDAGNGDLCGILHLPEGSCSSRPELGIIFVHAGSRGRLGNTFQYTYYARTFAAMGYPSFRFDPTGIGDSPGDIETCRVDDFYGSIQVGRYVPDTISAINCFYTHVNPKRLILFGLCGGAITALLTAPRSTRVDGLVLLSIPVLLDSSQQSELARIPRNYARTQLISLYFRKLFSLTAWKRLLTMQSEMDTIWTLLKAAVKGHGSKASTNSGESNSQQDSAARFNALFLEALDAMVQRKSQLLFLFGDDDTFRWEFEREFHNVYWKQKPTYARHCEIHYIPGCNHMFTLQEWQNQALDFTKAWFQKLF